jgi:heat shock protein HslJ
MKHGSTSFSWINSIPALALLFGLLPAQVAALVDPVDGKDVVASTPQKVRDIAPQNTAGDLGGTTWQLVKFQGGDDAILTPDDRAKYTVAFGTDGQVSVRIDCNRGHGTWKSAGPGQLQFGPLALTRAMCPPGSLHDHMVRQWGFVRSFVIKNGHLFLSLMADGGTYEFEPAQPGGKVAVPKEP